MRCGALHCVAVHGSAWQCVAMPLQCVALRCSALQCIAVRGGVFYVHEKGAFEKLNGIRTEGEDRSQNREDFQDLKESQEPYNPNKSVLQCVAWCCSAVKCVAVRCSVLQCGAVCCSAVQCVAVRCSVLQCVAVSEDFQHLEKIEESYNSNIFFGAGEGGSRVLN